MTLQWPWEHERARGSGPTIEEHLEMVRREQEALEKRVRLIEDLLAAIRREGIGETGDTRR